MLRIGEFARLLETTTKTLRHYEKMGLLPPSCRSESGYRMYGENAIFRARQVIGLRRLGLSIEEVRDLLNPPPSGTTRIQQLLGLLDEKVRDMDETLAVHQGRRDDLAARYLALLNTPPERDGNCICEALFLPCNCVQTAEKVDSRPQNLLEGEKIA